MYCYPNPDDSPKKNAKRVKKGAGGFVRLGCDFLRIEASAFGSGEFGQFGFRFGDGDLQRQWVALGEVRPSGGSERVNPISDAFGKA